MVNYLYKGKGDWQMEQKKTKQQTKNECGWTWWKISNKSIMDYLKQKQAAVAYKSCNMWSGHPGGFLVAWSKMRISPNLVFLYVAANSSSVFWYCSSQMKQKLTYNDTVFDLLGGIVVGQLPDSAYSDATSLWLTCGFVG